MTSTKSKSPTTNEDFSDATAGGTTDAGCGWGPMRPKVIQPLAQVWTFIVVYLAYSFTHGVQGAYTISVLTTLEKRFNLPSYISGSLVTVSSIGYLVSVLIFSFFFAKRHPPRLFAGCMLLTSFCALLYVIPHFIYGTGNDDIDAAHAQMEANQSNVQADAVTQLCREWEEGAPGFSGKPGCSKEESEAAAGDVAYLMPAIVLFAISEMLQGVAGAPVWTVGLAYIDDHTNPELSSKLIGLMFTVRFISPMVSFAMGGYLLSLYANLKATFLTPEHPRWIGAWWMGFLVCSIINFLLSIPTSMIPKDLSPISKKGNAVVPESLKENEEEEEEKEKEEDEKQEETQKEEAEMEEREQDKEEEEKMKTSDELPREESETVEVKASQEVALPTWKELPNATLRLVFNPIYMLASIAICIDCFILGFMAFLPKYFEVHFQKTAWVANLLGGMIPAVFGGFASYVGGVVSGKIKGIDGGVMGNCRMNFTLTTISLLLLVPAMFLSCAENVYAGHMTDNRLNTTTDCSVSCGCSSDVFDPVCGSDGFSYFSPCHAGCSGIINATEAGIVQPPDDRKIHSTGCRCLNDEVAGVAYSGFCGDSCSFMIPYVITLVAIFVSINLYNVPCTTIIMRCVDEADKSFALGLQTFGICLSVLPAPVLYGAVFESACLLRETTTCSESEGTCLAYDRNALRLAFHGLTIGLRVISTLFYGLTFVIARRKFDQLTAEREAGLEQRKNSVNSRSTEPQSSSVKHTKEL